MPALATLLGGALQGLIAWFAQYVTKKTAFGLAAVTAFSTITVALFVVFRATLATLASPLVGAPPLWSMVLGIAIPPAGPACISAYVTMWTACTVYTWKKEALNAFKNV